MVTTELALVRIAEARVQLRRVKALLSKMEARPVRLPLAERVADAIADASGGSPAATRRSAALEAAMVVLTRTIRTTFLG